MFSLDKIRGGLLGLALGDALGGPHEFRYSIPVSQYTGRLQYPIGWKARFKSVQYTTVGQVTDDTSMAGALLWSIATNHNWIKDDIIRAYIDWANSEAWSIPQQQSVSLKFMGRNTRALFKNIKTVQGYYNRYNRMDLSSQSNGSLMRSYPLILLFYYLPETEAYQKAIQDTALTNSNPVNQDATLMYLLAIRKILSGISTSEGIPQLISLAQTDTIKTAIQQAAQNQQRIVTTQKGWVAHAIYISMQAWLQAEAGRSFSDIMNWVIMQGGDTDTNGAIAGALVGTYLGEEKMKEEPITNDNIRILLEADYSQGELPISLKYHPRTLLQILR